ncbi:MAG: hypothetical protein ACE5JI_19250 [Acidobacteriota bacterium]
MRHLLVVVLVAMLMVASMPPAAQAGSEAEIALGLASFAVFNQLFVRPWLNHGPGYRGHYHAPYGVLYPQRYVYAYPQYVVPPPQPSVIYYPHGRYELRGDGVTTAYQWVWIPNPPPPPPPTR